jgi:hypothetical protein
MQLHRTAYHEKTKATLSKIVEDSKGHIEPLESIRESLRKIVAD